MIAYTDPDSGNVCQCSLASSVPEGVDYIEVESYEGKDFRMAKEIKAGKLVTNLTKAKDIVNVKRRAKRDVDFKPHDDIIMKQIPGADATAAEAARADIRTADDAVQTKIKNAKSEAGLLKIISDNSL